MRDEGWPSGLHYYTEYLDPTAQRELLERVDAAEWSGSIARRVQHYGLEYDYRRRGMREGVEPEPLPGWLALLAARLERDGHFARSPDQVIVNEYTPGQGIGAHVDSPEAFGPVVASISLGCAVEMGFGEVGGDAKEALLLEPGSLVVLSGDARYRWTHRIGKRKTDRIEGEVVRRGRRVSLTFRTLLGA